MICMHEQDVALNNLKGLICHKTQPNKEIDSFLNGLVWFYGSSTGVGNIMPNPVFTYILNI